MMQGDQQRAGAIVVQAAFDAHRALTDGGQALFRLQRRPDAVFQPQALEPGHRQDHRIVIALIQLGQAGTDVTAQIADDQVRPAFPHWHCRRRLEVPSTAPAGNASQTAVAGGNEGIAGIFPFANGRQSQPVREKETVTSFMECTAISALSFQYGQLQFFDK